MSIYLMLRHNQNTLTIGQLIVPKLNHTTRLTYSDLVLCRLSSQGMATILFGDIMLNFLNVGYSRAVIQNHVRDFRMQSLNFWKFLSKQNFSVLGNLLKTNIQAVISISMVRNLGLLSFKVDHPSVWNFAALNLLGHILAYPLLTIQRRLHCQANQPGMIPLRYSGCIN